MVRASKKLAYRIGKRTLDVAVAAIVLVALSWLVVLLWIMVRVFLGSPALFRQQRPGRDGIPFCLVKFRTMTTARDETGALLPDADRMTTFGRFLRSTSLDELPTMWNVLLGHMSLVGPRPLLMEYLPRYTVAQARRHEVRPGVTGWAQITGRNATTWDERLDGDVWYVDNASFALDLRILWKTFATVIRRDGISHGDHATMPKFQGKDRGEV